jgi:hypothetical protein
MTLLPFITFSSVQKKRITATSSLTSDDDETQIDPSRVLQVFTGIREYCGMIRHIFHHKWL